MYLGKPVEYGPVEHIFEKPGPPVYAALLRFDPEAREEVARAVGVDQGDGSRPVSRTGRLRVPPALPR